MTERIWDRFLTDSDRASCGAAVRVGFGTRPALLLVDLYRGAFGDRPEPLADAVRTWPGSCGHAGWDALPHIERVLTAARAAPIPIVHITGLDGVGLEPWSFRLDRRTRSTMSDEELDQFRRRYEIIDQVAPRPGETVIRKVAPSAFWGTPLIGHLTFLGVDTVIVVGESTSGCVRATVVEGATHRLRVVVAEDGVFDRHEACHAINLFDMDQKYADVLPADEIIQYLARWQASNEAEEVYAPGSIAYLKDLSEREVFTGRSGDR